MNQREVYPAGMTRKGRIRILNFLIPPKWGSSNLLIPASIFLPESGASRTIIGMSYLA